MKNSPPLPPDQKCRELILHDLDRNLLVEAAAGTGKTTSMTGRMVNLLAEGRCSIETLAAVTFTRKAAGELRSRFQIRLEQAAVRAEGPRQQCLQTALANLERCYIGTIHSFCARLLRERPIEAGVDLDFQELDDADDVALRTQAWSLLVAQLHSRTDGLLDELDELGLEVSELEKAFVEFAEFPDVSDWPRFRPALPDVQPALDALREYALTMARLIPSLPQDPGRDQLMAKYRRVSQMVRHTAQEQWSPARLMEILEEFSEMTEKKIVQKNWPSGTDWKKELLCWEEFRTRHAQPLLKIWHEYRYEPVLRTLLRARELYDHLRQEGGQLNFQDLLLRTAGLLRNAPQVRAYFRKRFTHVLVDEFQDTDPIQAEVLLYLTSQDTRQTDWRQCRPAPGSLFVVGDPKQSIYRFRRADITIYNEVRRIIEAGGGQVVSLTTNFRTVGPIVEWVNQHFTADDVDALPAQSTPEQAANKPMSAGREPGLDGALQGLFKLNAPKELANKADLAAWESDRIARFIRDALDRPATVPRSRKELSEGRSAGVQPGDFLIITRNTAHLADYAAALQRYGIPHQVTGSSSLNQVPELALLYTCLRAVLEPNNPVALLAVLRSELFGLSDPVLYAYQQAGGRFSYNQKVPAGLVAAHHAGFEDAFARLKKYALWLAGDPPVSAIERILADLGLFVRAASGAGGCEQAGSMAKAVELLRSAQGRTWSTGELVDYLGTLVGLEEKFDSLPIRPHAEAPVRVMNLHKVKGLEAPIVFLADPTGESDHEPRLYVDRTGGQTTTGYLAVSGSGDSFGHADLLACPTGWADYAARENRFAQAEAVRLRYVAATRAGAMLVIAQREKGNEKNPWQYFEPDLADAPLLPDPGPQQAPLPAEKILSPADASTALNQIETRWQAVRAPTYAVGGAKALALHAEDGPKGADVTGEGGLAWGSVIHLLLEQAMRNPQADLRLLARSTLAEEEMDVARVEEAVHTVQAVVASALWRRAQAAKRRWVEVPLQTMLDDGGLPVSDRASPGAASIFNQAHPGVRPGEQILPTESGQDSGNALKTAEHALPTLIHGVIDLAFEEEAGWVLVDYKTDAAAKTKEAELVEHYRPQLALYARAWQKALGIAPVELGLFFVATGKYVQV